MKKNLLVVVLVAVAVSSFALAAFAYDGWSSGKVTDVRYQPTRTFVIQSGATNPGGCSTPSYLWLTEDGSEFAKRASAAIAIAIVTGREVSFALTGCSGGGTTGYPVITEVWLKD